MTSQVGICNIALTKVGAAPIVSLDDSKPSAATLRSVYDALLDAELSEHPWQFAIARVALPSSSPAPPFEWGARYPLPADFLKLVRVGQSWCFYNPEGQSFTVEGNAILTNADAPLEVSYVKRITAAGTLPASFVQAFATRLAADICETLTQNASKRQELLQEHEMLIKRARRSNDIQLPPQRAVPQSWELSLYGAAG